MQGLANVESALRLIERLPEALDRARAEFGLRLLEGRVVPVLYGMASGKRLETAERVCQLSQQVGDDSALLLGLFNMVTAYANRGELQHARKFASRCLQIAESDQNRELLPPAYARLLIARCAYGEGDLLQASSLYDELIASLAPQQRLAPGFTVVNWWAFGVGQLACVRLALGRPDEALKLSEEALRRARQLNHPVTIAWILTLSALVRNNRREPEAVRAIAEAQMALAEEHGLRERLEEGRALRAWAMAQIGHTEQLPLELETTATLTMGLSLYRLDWVLNAYLQVGLADRALDTVNKELARVERSGNRLHEPELHRLKGEAILMRDSSATGEAEDCFHKAIEIARGQSGKWWELRATVSLARLLRETGRRDEARSMLANIYNWFTEGFDTADLKDAKTLLEELSA
jgi:tetratricopeptide (TPR) repeat protein